MRDLARKLSTEADIRRGIIRRLALAGFDDDHLWRQQAGRVQVIKGERRHWMHLAPEGASDWVGIVPRRYGPNAGRHFALETKKPGGAFRKGQIPFLQRINAAGGIAFWADSIATVDIFLKWLPQGRVVITVADDGAQRLDLA